jgi:hypothetical protein
LVSNPSASLAPHAFTPQEAADRAALSQLVAAYGHAIDRRDYRLLDLLYHEDAIDDHRPYFYGSARDYVAWVPLMMANWKATSHVMMGSVFMIDGDYAEGITSARAWHRTLDGQNDFTAWGRYVDQYERRDGIWRFAKRMFVLDATEEGPAGQTDAMGTEGVALSSAGADDPAYAALRLLKTF